MERRHVALNDELLVIIKQRCEERKSLKGGWHYGEVKIEEIEYYPRTARDCFHLPRAHRDPTACDAVYHGRNYE